MIYIALDARVLTFSDDRKMHLTNPDVGHVTGPEGILLSEPHPDWAEGRTIDLYAWDGELVAHIEVEDRWPQMQPPARRALPYRARSAFRSLPRALSVSPSLGPAMTWRNVLARAAYFQTSRADAFERVDDFTDIAAMVGFETAEDALLARGTVALILGTARSVLSGADFMAQEGDFGGLSEVTGDYD